ncbi:hypothetical protein BCR34DRAFT_607932 [Clohesyomyces aquaticus]|uniref:Uncharacterized protein n=1 Tax=Clohesyomyces aquaticus TaxID=1231657 RepID=A0A1Y1YBY0_9PLEO|nr:hypothetical protein BCR34DRAFT_607932 [Clohesyomyces aquaticus]
MSDDINCNASTLALRTHKGFDFQKLFEHWTYLNATCPEGSSVFYQGTRLLSDKTCRIMTGLSEDIFTGWTPYPISVSQIRSTLFASVPDIWTRIVTWKLSLFQLLSQFPRPPLGMKVEIAVMAHLLGDPIDSLSSILLTLALCKSRVQKAKEACREVKVPESDRVWKALAMIMISYDECGKSGEAKTFLEDFQKMHRMRDIPIAGSPDNNDECASADGQMELSPLATPDPMSHRQRPTLERSRLSSGGDYQRVPSLSTDRVSVDETPNSQENRKIEYKNTYETAAFALAADRSTKTLPVAFAEIFFVGGWMIALARAASAEPGPGNWINVEAHSVAFSALYLWVTSVVVLGAIIGASQTEDSIPRILQRYEIDMNGLKEPPGGPNSSIPAILEMFGRRMEQLQNAPAQEGASISNMLERLKKDIESLQSTPCPRSINEGWCEREGLRAVNGGVYSWKPRKWRPTKEGTKQWGDVLDEANIGTGSLLWYAFVATMVVGSSLVLSSCFTYLVPPKGPSCRHIGEGFMFSCWAVSFAGEFFLERFITKDDRLFTAVVCKDVSCALINISIILITQWGIFYRCACWTDLGRKGLALPQIPEIKRELMDMIRDTFPWVVGGAITFHILFCLLVAVCYRDALRVFLQRDDGMSNFWWRNPKQRKKRLSGQEAAPHEPPR